MKIKSKRVLRIVVCLLLSTCVLACSFSAFAVDVGDRVTSWEALWAYYIYEFLSSIGIDVTYQGIIGYTDQVQDTIIDWVINYIADLIEADSQPSNYSIAQWVAPWQAEYDYWGNLKYNSTMLEDMEDFAEWLKQKFSLVDNDSMVVDPIFVVSDGIILYDTGKYYRGVEYFDNSENAITVNNGAIYMTVKNSSNNEVERHYFYVLNTEEHRYYTVIVRYSTSTATPTNYFHVYLLNDTNAPTGSNIVAEASFSGSIGYTNSNAQSGLQYFQSMNNAFAKIRPEGANAYEGTTAEINSFLSNLVVQQVGDISIVTSQIVMPSDNPSYESGDGVIIIDGVPDYQPIVIDHVTVDNLPAIVSTGTIENPHMEEAYRPVQGLIEMTKDGVELMHGIVNELPVEAVTCIYALIGAIIVFGMIKLMREH